VIPDGGGPEILIIRSSGTGALAGDRVEASVKETRWGLRGRIVDIAEAKTTGALGVVERSGRGYRVALERRDLPPWLNVPSSKLRGAAVGDRVWVRMTRERSGAATPNCAVEEILGPAEDPAGDFRAVVLQFGLDEEFPDDAAGAARALRPRAVRSQGRTDFRNVTTFTVDPRDAKDHDDALSYRELPGGDSEVGVHIADVAQYAPAGGAIDRAAKERGTSVYLCDGVVPMLPRRLSEDLCSLVPEGDRATLSVVFEMDARARVKRHRIVRGIIRSRAGLSYEGAEEYLEGAGSHGPVGPALRALARLSECLAERRFKGGALDMDIPETKVELDDRNAPTDVYREERLQSHRIIEEFMLLANEAVAARAADSGIPFIYRTHPRPELRKLEDLSLKLGELGVRFKAKSVREGRDIEAALSHIVGERRRALAAYLALRAMERARYEASPGRHFGLASDCYCHFTSPIRRYPDLYNHGVLCRTLLGGEGPGAPWEPEEAAELSTERETRAQAAERISVEIKCLRFMEGKLGERFTGMVTGVLKRGYTIELDDYPIEGFAFKPALRKRKSAGGLYLGDKVEVRVLRADPYARELELGVVKNAALASDN
jgi:ribonuclease R